MGRTFFFPGNRRPGLIVLTLLAATVPAFADLNADRNDVLLADEQLRQAFLQHDAAALNRLLADDWKVIHVNGREQTKAQFIDAIQSGRARFLSIELDQTDVRVYGNTAIVTARWTNTIEFKGERSTGRDRVTRVWVKQPEGWRAVTEQAVYLEESKPPTSASADEKEILRLTDVINAAWLKHDVATISPLIADDMQAWSFKGARRGKAELLRAVEKSEESDTKVEDPMVRVFGDAAVYSARITDTGKRANGDPFSVTSVVTNLWVRRAGKWQVVAEHESITQK
jgi:ketosteroid isomerase-like protein